MGTAARAIIIEQGNILVMHRNKYGSKYFTLVGGRVNDGETLEQALVREIHEETQLTVTHARLVFTEEHHEPYNSQYVYLCEVAPHADVAIHHASEENTMNQYGMNIHEPLWISLRNFENLPFRTPLLHQAILDGVKKGFPSTALKLQEPPKPLLKRIKKKIKKRLR